MKKRSERFVGTASKIAAGAIVVWAAVTSARAEEVSFQVSSPDLREFSAPEIAFPERLIANGFGCHGGNESPELRWSNPPAGTKSFAVTMFDDTHPPSSGWWHWLVFNLPGSSTSLPRGAGVLQGRGMPRGAVQGTPDGEAPQRQYYGPCPDVGDLPHHYVIRVYALNVDHLDVPRTATAADTEYKILSHALAHASIERNFIRLPQLISGLPVNAHPTR